MARPRRRRLSGALNLLLAAYFLGLLGYSEVKLLSLHRDATRLTAELHRYQAEGQATRTEIRELHNSQYLRRLAEQRFGLVDSSQIAYQQK